MTNKTELDNIKELEADTLSSKLKEKEKEYQELLEKIKSQVEVDSSLKNMYSDERLVTVNNSEIIDDMDQTIIAEAVSSEPSYSNENTVKLEETQEISTIQAYEPPTPELPERQFTKEEEAKLNAILTGENEKFDAAALPEVERESKFGYYDDVVLEVLGLTKSIGGKKILDDISFEIRAGEIVGLLGPNGAGKTTIMKILVGLMKASSGDIYCFEKDLGFGKTGMLSEVGSMIESPEFYNYLSGYSNLKQIARLCGKKISNARIKEVIEFVGLEKVAKEKVKTYSLGMRQRLGLAQALLHEPRLLILDEPVNGLDPQGVQDFRNKLKEIASQGTSILISSHLLDEVEKVSDRIIVIEKGKIVADDSITNLAVSDEEVTVLVTSDNDKTVSLLEDLDIIDFSAEDDKLLFANLEREEKAKIVSYLVHNNVEIESLYVEKKSLEDRFLEITGKGGL